jgi:hypothetical protein
MRVSYSPLSFFAGALFAACTLFFSSTALADDDGYVLFLDEYLTGDYYFARLRHLDRDNPPRIYPRKLRLPRKFRRTVEIGNADVSSDGSTIVFAARKTSDYDWNIYTGKIDLRRERIREVRLLVNNAGRDEDPRFDWQGTSIVYKCAGNICIYPEVYANPVVLSWCELWAPSFALSGYAISFTKRCGGGDSDRIWQYDLLTGDETVIPNEGGGADRFAQYMDDGTLLYSHSDRASGTSSLWLHDTVYVSLFHDKTSSDEDPYPDKLNRDRIAFIGWDDNNANYDLYLYRRSRGDSVQLTDNIAVLAPVLFRP